MKPSKYIGRQWRPEYDCLALAREVMRNEFGKNISVPDNVKWGGMQPFQAVDLAKQHAVKLSHPAEVRDGDAALMRVMGRKRCLGSHVGVVLYNGKRRWTLHNLERMGVLYTPISRLPRLSLELVGYFRWL